MTAIAKDRNAGARKRSHRIAAEIVVVMTLAAIALLSERAPEMAMVVGIAALAGVASAIALPGVWSWPGSKAPDPDGASAGAGAAADAGEG